MYVYIYILYIYIYRYSRCGYNYEYNVYVMLNYEIPWFYQVKICVFFKSALILGNENTATRGHVKSSQMRNKASLQLQWFFSETCIFL